LPDPVLLVGPVCDGEWHDSCEFPGMAKSKRRDEELRPVEPYESPEREADRERVARRAYELYLSRGAADGQDQDDWFVAEQELIRNRKPERDDS
jgi:DUF2934 family protein